MRRIYCDRCGKEIETAADHRRVELRGRVKDCCAGKCAEFFENMQQEASKLAAESRRELERKLDQLERDWLGTKPAEEAVEDGGATIALP